MESERQKKISSVLQKDLSSIIQGRLRVYGATNLIVSVTKVKVSPDLLNVKLYVSVFPFSKAILFYSYSAEIKIKLKTL